MALPRVTINGRLLGDVETKATADGGLIGRARILAVDRRKGEDGEWVDGDSLFMTLKFFNARLAGNAAESLRKGDLVTVTGKLRTVQWVGADGKEHTGEEVVVDTVAADLTFRVIRHHDAEAAAS
jgi:single-strand DNA-binding protein